MLVNYLRRSQQAQVLAGEMHDLQHYSEASYGAF
jgi:hypothetical protein